MNFKVYINQGEWHQIRGWVWPEYKDIETGGDLFGLWLDEHTAVVQFVLGPGEKCRRTTTSFFQDVDYLDKAGTYLTNKHGLCNVGQWHSHHRINLFKPSVGDESTVWNNMPVLGLDRYIVVIANITNDVKINCFLFQIKNGQRLPVEHGEFKYLDGNSPLRLNEELLQNVHPGAESFNQLITFESEMKYIRDKDVKNENTSGNYTRNNEHDVVSVSNTHEKHKNSYTPKRVAEKTAGFVEQKGNQDSKSAGYIDTFQNTNKSIRNEEGRNQGFPASSRYYQEHSKRNTPSAVIVRSSEIPSPTKSVTLETENDHESSFANLPGEVSPNLSNQRKITSGRGSMSLTAHPPSGTDQEYLSDTNQTIHQASRAINSAEPNYELNRAKERAETRNAKPSTGALQNLPETERYNPGSVDTEISGYNSTTRNTFTRKRINVAARVTYMGNINKQDIPSQADKEGTTYSPDQQENVGQISHGNTKARFKSQMPVETPPQPKGDYGEINRVLEAESIPVQMPAKETITQQPNRIGSIYDNIEGEEPMDHDGEITDTGQVTTRPDTPSGTIANIANDDRVIDSDDNQMGILCGLFNRMNLCGKNNL